MKASTKVAIVGGVMLAIGIGMGLLMDLGILFCIGVYGGFPTLVIGGVMALIDYARR